MIRWKEIRDYYFLGTVDPYEFCVIQSQKENGSNTERWILHIHEGLKTLAHQVYSSAEAAKAGAEVWLGSLLGHSFMD